MLRKIISCIPNTITLLNLLSGCAAIIFAFSHNDVFGPMTGQQWAYVMIGAAALFDFLDGASARALRAYSAIGKELDSLSDLVSFGVAPAVLLLNVMLEHSLHPWLCYASLFIPAMGALRLAKFNVDTTQTTSFRGLPIPANAIFWIGACAAINSYGYPGDIIMSAGVIVMSLLMVLTGLKMFSLKFKNFSLRENLRRYIIIMAAILFVVFCGVPGLAWTIILYVLMSLVPSKTQA